MNYTTARGRGPLYAQVKAVIIERLTSGTWRPGQLIPGESRLAMELGVSQGTVRKAVDDLVGRNLLVRQQGIGTFVSVHDSHRALFHFLNITRPDGTRVLPRSKVLRCATVRANRDEARALQMANGERVVRIERVRHLDDEPTIAETVVVAAARFPGLSRRRDIPNTLYELYEKDYGLTIHRADEKVSAVGASAHEAELLGCATGHPLLLIDRLAVTLDETPVEWRVSRCLSDRVRYQNSII